jgi:CelD/BcsL family acetyltransferase involved in cellulose biosynthesis
MRRPASIERTGPDSRLRIRVLDGHALAAEHDAWQALCDRCPWATPFQRPDWLLAWIRRHRSAETWALAAWRGPRLVGLAPLHRDRRRDAVAIGFLGAGDSVYLDVLAEPGATEDVLDVLFAVLEALGDRWDVCELTDIGPDSPLWGRLPPWPTTRCLDSARPVLRLCAEGAGVRPALPERLRLERATTHGWPLLLDGLLALRAARGGTPPRSRSRERPGFSAMLREATAAFAARDALGLYGLWLDDRLVAALCGFVERRTLYCYLTGFDPRCTLRDPVAVLIGCVIEDAIGRGLRSLDLSGGTVSAYGWGATARFTARLSLRLPGAAGHASASP